MSKFSVRLGIIYLAETEKFLLKKTVDKGKS